jgi:hypothetical protein
VFICRGEWGEWHSFFLTAGIPVFLTELVRSGVTEEVLELDEVFELKKRGPADGLPWEDRQNRAEFPLFEKFLVRKLRRIRRGF